jgi:hypothetical protein
MFSTIETWRFHFEGVGAAFDGIEMKSAVGRSL